MAASRVNVKFVVILVSVLALGFVGMAGAYFFVIKRSPEQNIELGDKKFAEGNYKAAEMLYSKAVYKEQTNIEFLTKWKSALEKVEPETESEFNTRYANYVNLIRQMAVVQKTNVAAHREYLETFTRSMALGAFDLPQYQRFVAETDDTLKYFEGVPPEEDNWQVLRRYRGQAVVRMMAEAAEQVDEARELQAKEDLEAALKADPTDAETALTLEDWYHIRAIYENRAQRPKEAEKLEVEAGKVADAFLAANPTNMAGHLSKLRREMEKFRLKAVDALKQPRNSTLEAKSQIQRQLQSELRGLVPELDRLSDVLKAKPPADVSLFELFRLQAVEAAVDPDARLRRTEELLRARLTARPDDSDALLILGRLLSNRQDFAGALEQYQRLVDLPQKAISYGGGANLFGQKLDAAYQLCLTQIKIWAKAPEAQRDAELKKAKELRQQLSLRLPEESKELKYIDAQLAYAQRDFATTQRLITSYNQDTRESNPDALWLLAQTAIRLEQPGLADTTLSKLLDLRPDFYDGLVLRGDIVLRFEQRKQALELWKAAYAVNPNEELKKKIDGLTAIVSGGKSGDPVVDALVAADNYEKGDKDKGVLPNPERAMAVLVEAYESTQDIRLIRPIAVKKLEANDNAGALEFVRRGLQQAPDNLDLKQLEIVLSEPDPLKAKLRYLDLMNPPPLERALQTHAIYRSHKMHAEADAALAEAVKLSPQDPRVIEMQFIQALQNDDRAKARLLSDQAVAVNADREQGLTFRARLAVMEGRLPEGISLLQQATQRGSANVETWRLLGSLQTQAGRPAEAAESYKRAVELRPTDTSAVYEYILSLAQAGQMDEALRNARDLDRFAAGDERFVELRLALESNAPGGDKDWAIKMREANAVRKPEDFKNKLYLTSLLMDKRFMPKARGIIDEVRAKNDNLEWASMDARWYADQGDAQGMQKVVDAYLAKLPSDKLTADPYIGFGQFFISRGLPDQGFRLLEEGRKYQDPKTMDADRALADNLARLDRRDDAIPVYRRIVEGHADDADFSYTKRLTELLVFTGKHEEAQKLLLTLGGRVNEDPVSMMLNADAMAGLAEDAAKAGDAAKARSLKQQAHEIYDRAVSTFPNEPLVYMKRAQIYVEQPEMVQNVLADLDAALKLKPGSWQALKLRAGLFIKLNRTEEAIADLRQAIKFNPTLDEIRTMLMAELVRRGRAVEAQDVATEALRRRPNDLNLLISFGDTFRAEGQMERAETYYKTAWELNKTPQITLRLLEAQLNRDTPNLAGAADVLKAMQADVDKDPALLMARAKLLAKRGQVDAAMGDAQNAVKLVPSDRPEFILAWYSDLRRVQSNSSEVLRFLEGAAKAGVHPEWMAFFRAGVLAEKEATRSQGLEVLNQLIERGQQQAVVLLGSRLFGSTFYTAGDYPKAAEAYKRGLARFPDDWEMNNNLAYVLAFHLNQAEEAVKYAQNAVKLVPDNADAQDTLGVALMRAGKLTEAEQALSKAVSNARTSKSRVGSLLHLGELRVAQKRRPEAEKIAEQIEDLIRVDPSLASSRKELDELTGRISSLPR